MPMWLAAFSPSFAPIACVCTSSSETGSSPDWRTATRLLASSSAARVEMPLDEPPIGIDTLPSVIWLLT